MSDVSTTSIWADIGSFLLGTLENRVDVSIVGPDPTALTPLPAALGGTPDDATALAATATTPDAFLELLRAKAQFLMLPDQLIKQLRDASAGVLFAGVGMTGAQASASTAVQLGAEMPAYLAALAGDLGRQQSTTDPETLGALYGELCRVWLQLVAVGDPTWQQLRADGINHYQDAVTADGGAVDPETAWRSAVVEYVSVRVQEWYRLLRQMANAHVTPVMLAKTIDADCAAYDAAFERVIYGRVDNSPLMQPPMPSSLITAADEYLLGLNALTCRFANTPLVGVLESLKAWPAQPPVIENLEAQRLIAATALAEADWQEPEVADKQETHIIWIYVNLVTQKNSITMLRRSAAYSGKQSHYKVALYLCGDRRYAGDKVGKEFGFTPGTVQSQAEKGLGMQSRILPRATALLAYMDRIAAGQEVNPYPGWFGQGNGDDFNEDTSGTRKNPKKWRQARAYWWLQNAEPRQVEHTWVVRLEPDKRRRVQFVFHEDAIAKYFLTHPMKEPVDKYVPPN